ncbi:isoaspartyl peptidase/L-asparaginase [Pelomonas sp. SE-A7]|uniref:isoaspartyl peptidase/L-asparaginase family protein n=1 Tax=Pelomonas sp. SE-A7 TaxID=3054953 RepID=UPI00259CF991|nr:isoaspartyl peptidase/L-asparaginase [Pelomonas sp. SE-A7]MDM4765612.1 isoaspartyl peptidase/L-asparaginase [Pelomonas sp. SE-A7]
MTRPVPVLAIHGGAGTLLRSKMSAELELQYRAELRSILLAGEAMLAGGAAALDVVCEAVRRLEECPLFNAGKGAVYTADERHELDASVMEGSTLRAGAVAGVSRVRNPVLAARAVMDQGEHLLFIGEAAERYVAHLGLEMVEPDWFGTPQRLAQLRKAQADALGALLDHDGQAASAAPIDEGKKFGTVGAVALDAAGHLAAATSTGGMTNKLPGRVGDSPLIGAGCYASDASCAVSCTGTGEAFIRIAAAREVGALMEYAGLSVDEAARRVVFEKLAQVAGSGGLIAVSREGEVSLPFNTEGMYRGQVRVGAVPLVGIYGELDLQ